MTFCRICLDDKASFANGFQSPCLCKGSMEHIHSECLENVIMYSSNICTICKTKYNYKFRDLVLYFFCVIIVFMFLLLCIYICIVKFVGKNKSNYGIH